MKQRHAAIALALALALVLAAATVAWLRLARPHTRSTAPARSPDWRRVVALLQYVEDDYVEAIESNHADEIEEQALVLGDALDELRAGGEADSALAGRLRRLQQDVRERAEPIPVHEACMALVREVAEAHDVKPAPDAPPDLARGKALYAQICASCHGDQPGKPGPAGAALHPSPPSFFLADTVNGLTPWKVYDFVTYGIPRTPMASFASSISEADRWALAFYVFSLRQPACVDRASVPRVPLDRLGSLSDNEIVARFGEASLPCLRGAPGP